MRFPQVTGKSVQGQTFHVPDDFAGEWNIVLLAFTEAHQLTVNTWLPFARTLEAQGVGVYELPTLPRFPLVQRLMLDYWMYSGIPDQHTRETTVTLYTDVAAFVRALGLPNTDTAYTLLLDPNDEVVTTIAGAYTPDKGRVLLDRLPVTLQPAL